MAVLCPPVKDSKDSKWREQYPSTAFQARSQLLNQSPTSQSIYVSGAQNTGTNSKLPKLPMILPAYVTPH